MLSIKSKYKSADVGGNCKATFYCIFCYCFNWGYSFFLTCAIFPILFAHDYLKNFLLEILGFLRPKLGTNDHFAMTKDNICRFFGLHSGLNQVKSPF